MLAGLETDDDDSKAHLFQLAPDADHDALGQIGAEEDEAVSGAVLYETIALEEVAEVDATEGDLVANEFLLVFDEAIGTLLFVEGAVFSEEGVEVAYGIAAGFDAVALELAASAAFVEEGVTGDDLFRIDSTTSFSQSESRSRDPRTLNLLYYAVVHRLHCQLERDGLHGDDEGLGTTIIRAFQ